MMEKAQTLRVENFLSSWNAEFSNHPLKANDLKVPHAVMQALFQVFDRLGIDGDIIMAAPPEECNTESTYYYRDLLPVLNMTRVIDHVVSVMPQMPCTVSVAYFLQPTILSSHSMLLLLFNLMLFHEDRLRLIAPYEDELFAKTEQVKSLEERKNKLVEMLNKQAEECGERAQRLEVLEYEIKKYEEELKQEKEAHDKEKQEHDALIKKNQPIKMLIEQKKATKEALLAEVARKKALRVYDADDVKAQAEQAAQNNKEADEKLNSLREILMQKENSLKNLQTMKPTLDTANNLLHEIMQLSKTVKDFESGDLESESKDGEIDVLNTDLSELNVQLSELQAMRAETADKRQTTETKRQNEKTVAVQSLREAEDKDGKCRERCKEAVQRIEEIKQLISKYDEEKTAGLQEINNIKNNFCATMKNLEDMLIKKVSEVEKSVGEKLKSRYYD